MYQTPFGHGFDEAGPCVRSCISPVKMGQNTVRDSTLREKRMSISHLNAQQFSTRRSPSLP